MRQLILSIAERYVGGRWRASGDSNATFSCPFHDDKNPSFSVNVDKGLFHCFSCKRSGNIIRLLKMLQVPDRVIDEETRDLRDEIEANKARLKWRKYSDLVTKDPHLANTILPETILQPYLYAPSASGPIRALPTKLTEAGFDYRWLDYMEIGFDRINNRITYPIRDLYGNLAGISGGSVIAGQYPKYKVYIGKYKDPQTGRIIPSDYGEWFDEKYPDYDFKNHDFIWNFDNVYPSLFFGKDENAYLIVVEGFKACLWLLQCGYTNTVALLGSSLSERQASLLHRLRVRIVLFLDNDTAGKEAMKKIGSELWKQRPGVFIAHYPYADECQPDDLSQVEVAAAVQGAVSYPHWITRGLKNT